MGLTDDKAHMAPVLFNCKHVYNNKHYLAGLLLFMLKPLSSLT